MGTTAVAVIIAKERDLVAHFRRAGALSAATARSAAELGVASQVAWNILERRAIIREATPGRYYLDEVAWEASRQRRRRLAIVMLVIVLAVLAVAVTATVRASAT